MVEVFTPRVKGAAGKAADVLNDTNIQTGLIGAAIAGATTFLVSGAATKERIKAVFDDIVDMSLLTPVGTMISTYMPNAAVQGTMVATSLLSGLGIGERLTDIILNDDMFDGEGNLKPESKMMVAAAAAAVAGLCVYITPKIQDALKGQNTVSLNATKFLNDADNVTGILIKVVGLYLVAGLAYALYGRFSVADANSDGKCTQAEFEDWMDGIEGLPGMLKPAVIFFKPFLAAVPGFDRE